MRRPLMKPLKSKCLGNWLNSYLEMPLGVLLFVLWFLVVTAWALAAWIQHYQEYYLPEMVFPGAMGRVSVYTISMASWLGTRRWSFSWYVWEISYEKTLKAHYVVGTVAGFCMIMHGLAYATKFGLANIPSHQLLPAYVLLTFILIVLPFAMCTDFRIRFYWAFKITHWFAPAIVITACIHIITLCVDGGGTVRGLAGAFLWVFSAASLWIGDTITSRLNAWALRVSVVDGPTISADDSSLFGVAAKDHTVERYIRVRLQQHRHIFPGAWLQVTCPKTRSVLGHPFTAIVRSCGYHGQPAEVEFLWKVNPGMSWTRRLHDAVMVADDGKGFRFFLTGPHGGGLGSLKGMGVVVFVVAGVGVTPAASLVTHLVNSGIELHVIWSARSAALISYVATNYFGGEEQDHYFARFPSRRHIHFTHPGALPEFANTVLPGYVKMGRPKIADILSNISQDALEHRLFDVGVFVCGPGALVADVLGVADTISKQKGDSHLHVHSESFQM